MFDRENNASLIFVIILILVAMSRGSFDLESTLLTLPGLILALTVHEYAHAVVSDRLGDPTPSAQGRLTLNPFAHLDPIGTAFLIFAGFGWGKPVQVNERYYRNPVRDTMLVALAGPVSNFIQGFFWFMVLGAMVTFMPMTSAFAGALYLVVLYAASINISLGVFNLLPLPPLDGSKILRYFLHGKARDVLYTIERYSPIILLVLFATDLTQILISPIIGVVSNFMLWVSGLFWSLF